ncbi:MAG: hypothetical protein HQM13_05820 [SAR324 cluster bacterium]|nr:hypothetical protein [SAR324 cluster bacterium]
MNEPEKSPSNNELPVTPPARPANLQQYVEATMDGIVKGAAPQHQAHVKNILLKFQEFLANDEITENKSFAAIFKLLRYGLEFNERRIAKENKPLQSIVNEQKMFTVKELQSVVKERMKQVPPGEAAVMEIVAEFNQEMLKEFNRKFPSRKERLFASTVNFVSETGFSKILESIYYASPEQTKEIAFIFLKKIFKNTYDVVQKMDKKLIRYPCVFLEPLHPKEQEEEQIPPKNQKGLPSLCYDFDIGNLYSYLDILANVLRKMLNRQYITERYQYYTDEKKRNNESGYISYPLLLSLILKNESKKEIIDQMILLGQEEKNEIKAVLLEFIKTLQTHEFLYLYTIKRHIYLKHFVLELLQDKQLASIPNFYVGMVITGALLSNEQFKVPYDLIELLMDESQCYQEPTKTKLAESLGELSPKTLDDLLRYILKGSYLIAGKESKKILEKKFEEAKVLSAVEDPLTSIMQGLTELGMEETAALAQKVDFASETEMKNEDTAILGASDLEGKFARWQDLIKQIFQWQVKRVPSPLTWIEKTSTELESQPEFSDPKDSDPAAEARLSALELTLLPDDFTFFTGKTEKWQDKIQFIEKYFRRRGICLGLESAFKEVLRDLLNAVQKFDAVHQSTHVLEKDGTFEELSLVVKLPREPYYKLPTGQHKGNIQLFLGVGLIPMKKQRGAVEIKPCLFLFQEVPGGFQSKGSFPLNIRSLLSDSKSTMGHTLLEIPLSESYYAPTLLALYDALQKWLPLPAWEKETTQRVIRSIRDFHELTNSGDTYGAVGSEMIKNPNKSESAENR